MRVCLVAEVREPKQTARAKPRAGTKPA